MILGEIPITIPAHGMNLLEMTINQLKSVIHGARHQKMKVNQQAMIPGVVMNPQSLPTTILGANL